jgi:DegV family protein with EDD domain
VTVLVLTDTAASISPTDAAACGLALVPLTVIVGGHAYRDTDVTEAMLANGRPTTSGPPPGDFLAALQEASAGAVVVTVATALSSTNASALAAARLCDVPVEVVDSESASGGQTLVALAAAQCAGRGGTVAQVATAARDAARDVRLVGALSSLDGLARTGRVPGLVAGAARRTGWQFIFTLRNGVMRPTRPAATRAAAIDRMVELCVTTGTADSVVDVAMLGESAELQARFTESADARGLALGTTVVADFGTAISVYTGPHLTGLAWRWRSASS